MKLPNSVVAVFLSLAIFLWMGLVYKSFIEKNKPEPLTQMECADAVLEAYFCGNKEVNDEIIQLRKRIKYLESNQCFIIPKIEV